MLPEPTAATPRAESLPCSAYTRTPWIGGASAGFCRRFKRARTAHGGSKSLPKCWSWHARRSGRHRLDPTIHQEGQCEHIIPPPMFNLVRYYGALGTASPLRAAILRVPPPSTQSRPTAPARPARLLHAQLLLRVFARDLYACPCGGRLTPIAVIRDPTVVQAILAALIEAANSPPEARPVSTPRRS